MKQLNLLLIIAVLAISCGKKEPDAAPATPDATGKSTLLFPAQNSECTTGTIISAKESTITFNWTAAANAELYELTAKNLLTGVIVKGTATTNQLQLTLSRNTPYSWYITSSSSKTSASAQSDTWKFYNAGAGIVNYAPFPAEIISPTFNQAVTGTTINLVWKGSSVDNDIASYDVYFGTTASPVLFKSNITDMFLNSVSITGNTQYYWKIVTHDIAGNVSTSDTNQFKVN